MIVNGIDICTEPINGGVALELPYIAGKMSGDLLVMGCGSSLWTDVAAIYSKFKGHRMGINDVIMQYPDPLEHGACCHSYHLLLFTLLRRDMKLGHPHMYSHSCDIHDWDSYETHLIPQFVWYFKGYKHGSSSLHGVMAGLAMGYDRIILAGVPMDNSGHYYNPFWKYDYSENFMTDWIKANEECFNGRVTSLSGNTRELLGAPEWLLS